MNGRRAPPARVAGDAAVSPPDELHVKAFRDSNADGTGDFAGLASRLDYLLDLGIGDRRGW